MRPKAVSEVNSLVSPVIKEHIKLGQHCKGNLLHVMPAAISCSVANRSGLIKQIQTTFIKVFKVCLYFIINFKKYKSNQKSESGVKKI